MTQNPKTHHSKRPKSTYGFALIVTISLMALLALLLIGLLSLSSVTLRSSSQSDLAMQARANARMAMIIAIGEVQKTLGPDRSASAPASAIHASPAQPHATGVWESWSFDPTSGDTAPDYTTAKQDLFKGWLMSDDQEPGRRLDPDFPTEGPANPVLLVGEGSATPLDQEPTKVHGGLINIENSNSSGQGFAWVALQEDVKAHVQPGTGAEPSTKESRFASLFAPDESGLTALGFVGTLPDDRADRQLAISTPSLALAGSDASVPLQSFHHLSPHTMGVLADANEGGLRRDLTTEFEDFGSSDLSGERLYSLGIGNEPWWDHLADYYNLSARIASETSGGGTPLNIETDLRRFSEMRGRNSAPRRTVLTPVMAKMDIVFSMVTHRIPASAQSKYATADPSHAPHYAPYFVFEPIVTLWNPYNIPIEFEELKLYFDKLPIGLRFQKQVGRRWIDVRRQNDGSEYWWPLSKHTWGGENRTNAITEFFIRLRGGTSETRPGGNIILLPGETRIFTAHVAEDESWGQAKEKFYITGATDAKNTIQSSGGGVDYTGGWNRTGGFRIDHLARWQDRREPASLYPFERTMNNRDDWHWVALRGSDAFRARVRLMDNDNPDNDPSADNDRERSFNMRLSIMSKDARNMKDARNVINDMTIEVDDYFKLYAQDEPKIIMHEIVAEEAFQSDDEKGPGGKSSFAVLSLTAKPTRDLLHPTKGWLFGNPATASVRVDEEQGPYSTQSYEISFLEIFGSNGFPMVDIDINSGTRGFFGPGQTSEFGLTSATMFSLPTEPMVSVGQFHTANILSSGTLPHFNYPVGNSHAHPLLPSDRVRQGNMLDHSYALNWKLWDSFYFSSLSKNSSVTATEFADGSIPLNSRMIYHSSPEFSKDEVMQRMSEGNAKERGRRIASHQLIRGPFNVSSTSVEAWRAVLSSLRSRDIPTRDGANRESPEKTPFARTVSAISTEDEGLSIGAGAGTGGEEEERAERWVGLHLLDDEQIKVLATHIVEEIKKRGQQDGAPVLTIGEFINRRPGESSSLHSQMGILQTAIHKAQEEAELYSLDDGVEIEIRDPVNNEETLAGNTAEGSPAHLLQGDILQGIGSTLTTHSDTLRLRTYGRAGEGNRLAEAWCEAIIQRIPDYVDPINRAEESPVENPPTGSSPSAISEVNKRFGRSFRVVSFRWLNRSEV